MIERGRETLIEMSSLLTIYAKRRPFGDIFNCSQQKNEGILLLR
jgi:hypothetical protein